MSDGAIAILMGIGIFLFVAYNFPVFTFVVVAAVAAIVYYFNFHRPKEKERQQYDEAYKAERDLYDEAVKVTYPPTVIFTFNTWVPEWFVADFNNLAISLYADEFIKPIAAPLPPVYGAKSYPNMGSEWRRDVDRRIHLNKTDGFNRFLRTLEQISEGLLSMLPSNEPSFLKTTLFNFYPRPVDEWSNILSLFWHNDIAIQFQRNFHQNRLDYSGKVLSQTELKEGKLVNPDQHKGTQDDALTRFFRNTPFYEIFSRIMNAEYFFPIPSQTRFAGTWIVAPPGRGKTNLLHHMIAFDRKQRGTIVLMDSKGDMINSYRGYADTVIIDPQTAHINPLQLGSSTRSVEFLEYIFSALLETGMTALQKTLFRSVLSLLLKVPNATLETFRQCLTTGIEPYAQYVQECDPATADFFTVGKPTEFNSPTYKETKQQILWRLRLILSNDYLRTIFTSPTTNVPFGELLDSGKTIIIDNSKDDLGEDGAEFFGRFFVALVWMAAVGRSRLRPEQKIPVYFYIDECHTVIKRDTKITTILDECRSQKIALILAHQRVAQIEPNVIDALNNCAIRIANSDDDAEALAKRFRVDAPALRLPVGSFACFVRDQTDQARTVSVPEFDMSGFPPATARTPPVTSPRAPNPPKTS